MSDPLFQRILIAQAKSSCTCSARGSLLTDHNSLCHYRLFGEALEALGTGAEKTIDFHTQERGAAPEDGTDMVVLPAPKWTETEKVLVRLSL